MTRAAAKRSVVELRQVWFDYQPRRARQTWTLRDVSFALAPAQIVGLIGPPACGKTALLKLLCGLQTPQKGSVNVLGHDLHTMHESEHYAVRTQVGMVFQNNALFDSLTVEDNIAFPLRMQGLPNAEIKERVAARLNDVGLSHASTRYPNEISGGMKKRVSVGRATIAQPKLCLYDEPTAGLDPVTAAKIYALITRFAAEDGSTALIISNELDTLLPACERVMMLFDGEIVHDGSTKGLSEAAHPAVRQFVVGANEGPL